MLLLLTCQICLYILVGCNANDKNLALNKPTEQSSDYQVSGGHSPNAVDGNNDPDYGRGSCTHTEDDYPSWWLVDLRDAYVITAFKITNRRDPAINKRLANFSVEVSMTHPTQLAGFPDRTELPTCVKEDGQLEASEKRQYRCDKPIVGRFLTVIKFNADPDDRPLTICELEVFGYRREVKFKSGWSFSNANDVSQSISGVRSRLECAKLCAYYPKTICVSFQMQVTTGVCELLSSPPGLDKLANRDWLSYQVI